MRDSVIITIAWASIITLLFLIVVLFLASIIRRGFNARKYRSLDRLRERYGNIIQAALKSGELARAEAECTAPPNSDEWQAVEDVLLGLIGKGTHSEEAKQLLSRLGYIAHYENYLAGRNAHVRAVCIDKLGKVKSRASVPKLTGLLDAEDPDIVSVTVRALSKIGGPESLRAIAQRLPALLGGLVVASKTVQTALLAFGADAIPALVEQDAMQDTPQVVSNKLEILSRLPAKAASLALASRHLSSDDAEVRSKALKVLGRAENIVMAAGLLRLISPLLQDPVWFVRLQAVRTARVLQCTEAAGPLGKLIFDQNWQVRNEAARALIMLGECSLDTILGVLNGEDRYAKDSVCEELENTGFSARLIDNLTGNDAVLQKKSRQILDLMCSLGFSTTLEAYRAQCSTAGERDNVRGMAELESQA
jgi:HEAT repeat protein